MLVRENDGTGPDASAEADTLRMKSCTFNPRAWPSKTFADKTDAFKSVSGLDSETERSAGPGADAGTGHHEGIMVWNGEPVSHAAAGGDRGFQAPSYEVEDPESFVGGGGAPVAGDADHEGPSSLLNFSHDGAPEASAVDSRTLNFEHNVIGEDGVDHHDAVHDVHHDANFDHGHHGLADHHIDIDL